jgi:hypothetical protein
LIFEQQKLCIYLSLGTFDGVAAMCQLWEEFRRIVSEHVEDFMLIPFVPNGYPNLGYSLLTQKLQVVMVDFFKSHIAFHPSISLLLH